MTIHPHGESAPVLVPQPLGHGRNIYSLLNTRRGEKMAQIMHPDMGQSQADTGICKSFPWVFNNEHRSGLASTNLLPISLNSVLPT